MVRFDKPSFIYKADHRSYDRAKTRMIGQICVVDNLDQAEFSLTLIPLHCSLINTHFDRKK